MAERAARRRRRPVDRHAVRPAADGGGRGAGDVGRRAGLPAVGRHAGAAGGRGGLAAAPLRRRRSTRRTSRPASAPRSSSPACPTGCGCGRPTATPSCTRRSATRPTRWAPRWPAAGRCRTADARPTSSRRRRRPGAVPVGQLARQPRRRARRPGAAAALGPGARRPGALRRVLHRVHLGRPGPDDLSRRRRRASWRCTRCPSGRTWPACGSASTPATPTWSTTCPRCASTPGSWSRARCRPPPSPPSATTRTSTTSASATARRLALLAACAGRGRRRRAPLPGGAFYLWVPAPGGDAWALAERLADRGRRRRVARASSTARRAPATSGSPSSSPTTGSRWWPSDWGSTAGDVPHAHARARLTTLGTMQPSLLPPPPPRESWPTGWPAVRVVVRRRRRDRPRRHRRRRSPSRSTTFVDWLGPGRRLRPDRRCPAPWRSRSPIPGGYSIYHESDDVGDDFRLPARSPTSSVLGPVRAPRSPLDRYVGQRDLLDGDARGPRRCTPSTPTRRGSTRSTGRAIRAAWSPSAGRRRRPAARLRRARHGVAAPVAGGVIGDRRRHPPGPEPPAAAVGRRTVRRAAGRRRLGRAVPGSRDGPPGPAWYGQPAAAARTPAAGPGRRRRSRDRRLRGHRRRSAAAAAATPAGGRRRRPGARTSLRRIDRSGRRRARFGRMPPSAGSIRRPSGRRPTGPSGRPLHWRPDHR